jgi:hypothetical protein
MIRRLVLIALLAGGLFASPQITSKGPAGQSFLIYRGNESFWTNNISGWVLDTEAGRQDGPIVVLYRVGKTWQTSEPVMYANAITPKTADPNAVGEAIKSDIAGWRSEMPDLVVTEKESIHTAGGQQASLRGFQSAATKRYESVAYIRGSRTIWLLVLAARSRTDHDGAFDDYVKWVRSYAPGPTVGVR